MRISPYTVLFIVAAAAGLFFAGFSTHDFVEHLDRQVHSINCSFIPGLATLDTNASSGCHVTMMSPYSSLFRDTMWGGLPIALPAMSVFAFLLFRGIDLLVNRGAEERGPRVFLLAAATLPLLTSMVMGYLSIVELGTACKLCMGIYASSTLCFVSALLELLAARRLRPLGGDIGIGGEDPSAGAGDMRGHVLSFGQGVGFVAIPALVYVLAMPDYTPFIGTCGSLVKPEDPYNVMVPLGPQGSGVSAIEVFDPLCPSCKGFEGRLDASGLGERMSRKALLFPLDNTCNWMIGSTLHPGACTISEAVLCADKDADAVVSWAFEHQTEIREASAADPKAAEKMVTEQFPKLKGCVGSANVKSKLNKSLRWAVSNQLPVLTPQLYVNGVKLCDEDTDLGMEYALTHLLDKQSTGAKP